MTIRDDMIDAGVRALDEYRDAFSDRDLVWAIYEAMAANGGGLTAKEWDALFTGIQEGTDLLLSRMKPKPPAQS